MILLLVAARCALARAQEAGEFTRIAERLSVRGSAHAALFVSRDQLDAGYLAYNRYGLLGDVQVGVSAYPFLTAELGCLGGAFLTTSDEGIGGVIAPTLGLRVHSRSRRIAPFLGVDGGPAFTGKLVRPLMRVFAGLDIAVRRGVSLGPVLGLGNVFQKNGSPYSTDGTYLFAGLSIAYRPLPVPPPKVVQRVERETVFVHEREEVLREAPEPEPQAASGELLELIESALPSSGVSRTELLAPVLFAFDKDELEPVGVAMLHQVARLLKERPDLELIAIRGYADRRGDVEYNRALAERRARRVLEWLVAHGVEPERLQIEAHGATEFVEEGESDPEHEQNRRVVFHVLRVSEP